MRTIFLALTLVGFGILAAGASEAAVQAKPSGSAELIESAWKSEHDSIASLIGQAAYWKRVAPGAFRPEALITESDRDPLDVVLRRVQALLADMIRRYPTRDWKSARERLDALALRCKEVPIGDASARTAVYKEVCRIRREIAFGNPLLDFNQILFVKRNHGHGCHMCDQYFGHNSLPGGGVYVLENAFGVEPRLRDVTAGAAVQNGRLLGQILGQGSFLSPELSFDGKTVVFAHSERTAKGQGTWRPENSYHLFRIGLDGSNLRQLGDGCWNEFDPCFLPNSKIAFISERRGGYGRCHGRPVPTYTLFRMNQDGSDIECLSYHETNEWHPVVGHDGKIVYTRWDYVDREPNLAHSAWTTTPDGRDPRAIYGNYQKIMHGPRPQMSMSIRPIPNSGKYIATATPHHGFAFGSLFLFDPLEADDGMLGSGRRITPDKPFPESEESPFKAPWTQAYGTPWPLSEDYYLCAYDDAARGEEAGAALEQIERRIEIEFGVGRKRAQRGERVIRIA